MYYKNNYYHNLGKSGYLNQNPQKLYSGSSGGSKYFQNGQMVENPDHMSEINKNILGIKRKNMSGIEEYESVYMKKIKSESCNRNLLKTIIFLLYL